MMGKAPCRKGRMPVRTTSPTNTGSRMDQAVDYAKRPDGPRDPIGLENAKRGLLRKPPEASGGEKTFSSVSSQSLAGVCSCVCITTKLRFCRRTSECPSDLKKKMIFDQNFIQKIFFHHVDISEIYINIYRR